ncbi:MAG TPA: hypothetical protein VMZ29_16440 [Candidatus Bathyarchaeia archaeon]|nr:hypothetical protein [Candidatus Bathyarchaeia archaeon]
MEKTEDVYNFILKKISEIGKYLITNNYTPVDIYVQELQAYFEGDAPSGDSITLDMVLQKKWLLVHEIIELSELKKQSFTINSNLLFTQPAEVFNAHLIATEWELALALKENDRQWIQKRLKDIQSWLADTSLNNELKARCKKLYQMYYELR